MKKNCPVAEARLLEKYKGLMMYDPDLEISWIIHGGNLEWKNGKWRLIVTHPSGNTNNDEPFFINAIMIGMIVDTAKPDEIEVIREDAGGVSV